MRITDNSKRTLAGCSEETRNDLRRIADIRLSDASASHLLIFPHDFKHTKDGLGENVICSIVNDELTTGNIMGFVGVNGTKLAITSRFENEGRDFFLHYMLQKVLALNVFDLKHSYDREDSFDFLIYLFPQLLQEAYRQGIFKRYVRREYNDANVKGVIDVARHIRQNLFFNGRIAYHTREYCYDNHITQLIRHTIEYIKTHPYANQILRKDRTVKEAVAAFAAVTPSYNRQLRRRVIADNLRPLQHPYFTAYSQLQTLCLAILRHDELKYGYKKDEVYGVLFDGAWLWEEYLYTILGETGFVHAENKERKLGIPVLQHNSWRWYPDFYKTGEIVLDAKYKRYDEYSVQADDWQQVIAYMYLLRATQGGLIFPSKKETCAKKTVGLLEGYGGELFTIPFSIPQEAQDMEDFAAQMLLSENRLNTWNI